MPEGGTENKQLGAGLTPRMLERPAICGADVLMQPTENTLPTKLLDPALHVIKNGTIFLAVYPPLYQNL